METDLIIIIKKQKQVSCNNNYWTWRFYFPFMQLVLTIPTQPYSNDTTKSTSRQLFNHIIVPWSSSSWYQSNWIGSPLSLAPACLSRNGTAWRHPRRTRVNCRPKPVVYLINDRTRHDVKNEKVLMSAPVLAKLVKPTVRPEYLPTVSWRQSTEMAFFFYSNHCTRMHLS